MSISSIIIIAPCGVNAHTKETAYVRQRESEREKERERGPPRVVLEMQL